MAFTGVAALIGAAGSGAAITAGMVVSAVAEVGTALTVVGAVTGSKDLMKIGGVMGAVGGIGSLITGGMSAAGSAAAASSDSGIVSSAIDASPSGAVDAMGEVNPTDMRLAAGTQAAPMASDLANGVDAGIAPADMMDSTPSGTDPFGGGAPVDPSAAPGSDIASTPISSTPVASVDASSPTAVATPAGTIATPSVTPGAITNPTDARLAAGTQATPMPVGTQAPMDAAAYWNKFMNFMQDPKNRTMIQMGSKLVGGALQGAEQESQFKQRVDLEKQRLGQTSYGSQVGQNRPRGGIIQGARQ